MIILNILEKNYVFTFYDIEKCFNSLWLADCLNSLWENGIQTDLLYLIYLLNHRARIQVKSPLGITDTFTSTDITKHGTSMGPILNNCSLDRICVEGQGYQLGSAYIKPLEYVDDVADPNNGFEEAIGSNADIERIQKEKRIHFSDDKSKLLKINNKSTSRTITVSGVPLKLADRCKCLGDYFDEKGNNYELIKDRLSRATGSINELISLYKEAVFGRYQIENMLLLYRSVVLPRVIHNSEAWSNLSPKDVADLQKAQLSYLRRVLEVHTNSCPLPRNWYSPN